MSYWLVKTEPETYSYADLEKLGRDRWNGVKNPVALKHLGQMKVGDLLFIYHTGKEKAIVGVGQVVSAPYPDPTEDNPRLLIVDVTPLYRLQRPVSLKEIKALPEFAQWELVRMSRLSVMPVPDDHWVKILGLATV